ARIDQQQLGGADGQADSRTQLKQRADALVIDDRATLADSAQVGIAVVLTGLGKEAEHFRIVEHQLITTVLADSQALLGQPDRRLTVVQELQSEHSCSPRISRKGCSADALSDSAAPAAWPCGAVSWRRRRAARGHRKAPVAARCAVRPPGPA